MESLTTRFQREVFYPYLELLKAQYRFHPVFAHARKIWEEKLTAKELVNGPYLEKSQIYEAGKPLYTLGLDENTAATIQQRLGERPLWKHQTEALELLLNGKNAVISTGTSSGKTLCYQIPILDDVIRDPSPGLRAVIIYPLNALVNDQLTEWEEMLKAHPQVTFARFTGQTPDDQIDYERRLRDMIRKRLADQPYSQKALQREVQRLLEEELRKDEDVPNRLNHRVAIRSNPPHVLVTNFSMLEYLLERPVDVPIFENARLKFLVLDEVHAYRGVQATEIAFLTRRLKDRLGLEKLTCIATSATLGRQGDVASQAKVRKFVAELFDDAFPDNNPVYGSTAEPVLLEPSSYPTPNEYLKAINALRNDSEADMRSHLRINISDKRLASLLNHDGNLYRLRKEILTKPTLLSEAAKLLWPGDPSGDDGLQALLEIVATVKVDESHEDLLSTRLHYFVKAQDGLYICLHKLCPGRHASNPAFFVSRKNDADTPDGYCPDCHHVGRQSKLVEVVTCRKCGYLFGALQDLGPRRAREQSDGNGQPKPHFDSFSTELGWVADSYWSYFSVEDDLPYPSQPKTDEEEEDQDDLFMNPAELQWCVACGKKKDEGAGDNCRCEKPHLRKIKVFHRQCPATARANLEKQEKELLTSCPNCGARNGSGIEPLRRFQESDDEMGMGMAIPLAHFQVTPVKEKDSRKLLCFTDHRQRAAAFPSLLEEETFGHDMGRKIIEILDREKKPLDLHSLGSELASIADPRSEDHDPDFFLPVSRYPDEELDAKEKRDLWVAETFGYFGIPDSARESAEDLGLVAVEFHLSDNEKSAFRNLLNRHLSLEEAESVLQVLLGYMRQRKAFTLPPGVQPDAPAFGRVTPDIAYVLRREGNRNTYGWLPHGERDNVVTDYLKRLFDLSRSETLSLAEQIWQFLISKSLLIESKERWKLDHEHLFITKTAARYVCNRCGIVTAYCARNCCPRKKCVGTLESQPFDRARENIIAQWVAGVAKPKFTTLKSEEHTAQISKDLAKTIEEEFRAAGVDLLSSTTTFELGINIGDLQKVLLRNAPPTSASYVQRVGRAGRGKDKNAICVTLCRRTKYDADAWNAPPRLMSGEVRPPTVFIQNKFIAQRHFNAAVFAKFLQVKIAKEHILGQVRQQVRLEAFLPVESRTNI
ncbi:DEAD/DEAH box helicase, partial [bacterium]